MGEDVLLDVENLSVSFQNNEKETPILKNLNFKLNSNSITAIVGESGSGKSITSLSIMGLLPSKISKITGGSIKFKTKELVGLNQKDFQLIRGNEIAMIFQEPMSSLNPSMRCGIQVEEILKKHTVYRPDETRAEILALFNKVKLPNPERIYKAYPHEISGGQKQRVMIAMAIACKPKILIADEPTTALDVTVQQEILDLIKALQEETEMSVLFISHDLSLVSQFANDVIVMYKGEIVEKNSVQNIFNTPQHTYTKALISARPSANVRLKTLPTISHFLDGQTDSEIISALTQF